jgi:hypothetical protein
LPDFRKGSCTFRSDVVLVGARAHERADAAGGALGHGARLVHRARLQRVGDLQDVHERQCAERHHQDDDGQQKDAVLQMLASGHAG